MSKLLVTDFLLVISWPSAAVSEQVRTPFGLLENEQYKDTISLP